MLNKLIKAEKVYHCFCSSKRLELIRREAAKNRETIKYDNRCRLLTKEEVEENLRNQKPFTIRFRLKKGPVTVKDLVFGEKTYYLDRNEGDPIIIKSDGWPTYHFANVVDDHLMKISHVLRGVEWLPSTPKHLMLYEAFGWPSPQFAHLPLIINNDGKKLSKRHNNIRIDSFREDGLIPETITNYLSHIGGGFSSLNSKKIYSLAQFSDAFDLGMLNEKNSQINTTISLLNRKTIRELLVTHPTRIISELQQHCHDEHHKMKFENVEYTKHVIDWCLVN